MRGSEAPGEIGDEAALSVPGDGVSCDPKAAVEEGDGFLGVSLGSARVFRGRIFAVAENTPWQGRVAGKVFIFRTGKVVEGAAAGAVWEESGGFGLRCCISKFNRSQGANRGGGGRKFL